MKRTPLLLFFFFPLSMYPEDSGYNFLFSEHIVTKQCPSTQSIPLILPNTQPTQNFQALGIIDIISGQLGWITTTNTEELALLYTATSADIPLTLVLRDTTGSFAATTITLQEGSLIMSNSLLVQQALITADAQALILAPVPLSAIQATNDTLARGASAVDLQMSKTADTQIAAGNYSVISGGQQNSVLGDYSVVAGGLSNTVTGTYSAITGGSNNSITGNYSSIVCGFLNTVTGNYATVINGTSNLGGADYSTIDTGVSHIISSSYSFISTGSYSTITSNNSAITTGFLNTVTVGTGSFATGYLNTVTGNNSSVFSGAYNNVLYDTSAIMGGNFNTITPRTAINFPAILGKSFIGAGSYNYCSVDSATNQSSSAILTGSGNFSRLNCMAIMGGQNNFNGGAGNGFVGNGRNNTCGSPSGILSGSNNTNAGSPGTLIVFSGQFNTASSFGSVTATGIYNNSGQYGSILSGSGNRSGTFATTINGQGNTCSGSHAIIGGGTFNTTQARLGASILTGSSNNCGGIVSLVANGRSHTSANGATYIFIANGIFNNSTSNINAILSGSGNASSSTYATTMNGIGNTASGSTSHIAGGLFNRVTGLAGCIVTGSANTSTNISGIITNGRSNSTATGISSLIKSGFFNTANGVYSGVLTGSGNSCTTNFSMVLHGQNNNAGTTSSSSCAGGSGTFSRTGSFVWTDNSLTNTQLFSTVNNQFMLKASAGSFIYTNSLATTGVFLAPGSNAWANLSDKTYKKSCVYINHTDTLYSLAQLPINTWNLITQDPTIVHIGPFAQDMYHTFGYGEDPFYINTSDALGILFSAYQGLYMMQKNILYHESLTKVNALKKNIDAFYKELL